MPRAFINSLSKLQQKHIPVLGEGVLQLLKQQFPQVTNPFTFIDGTAGCGGHSKLILNQYPQSNLLCVDRDPTNIPILQEALSPYKERAFIEHGNYSNLLPLLIKNQLPNKVNGILLDIGFNSRHIDEENRGFSYNDKDSPLDMRYDQSTESVSCSDLLNHLPASDIASILCHYGDLNRKKSQFIANKIVKRRSKYPFHTVGDLTNLLDAILPYSQVQTKEQYNQIFQAFRISVNQEFKCLETLLQQTPLLLEDNGVFMCIAFHSLEMKILKQFVYNYTNDYNLQKNVYNLQAPSRKLKVLTPKYITPTEEEIYKNPRSKSGMLYAFTFLKDH